MAGFTRPQPRHRLPTGGSVTLRPPSPNAQDQLPGRLENFKPRNAGMPARSTASVHSALGIRPKNYLRLFGLFCTFI
jgi:hypothetical protein